ncbi:tetratricopeptide repeat-containing sensor histidine kinase [Winogradskyella sp.]|uniref:tetratricopeptide repeat-containing sensor histidine kinase n=1 Tax=Winogradskyella sp. TaxID=1883156 RepID=UPI003BAC8D0F
MRKISSLFVLLSCILVFGQDPSLEQSVNNLEQHIKASQNGEKLKLMDSLCRLVEYNGNLRFDSITKATIAYAYKLDSTQMAIRHTSNLIFYYANRASNAEEGVKLFKDFEQRNLDTDNYGLMGRLYTNAADSYYFSGQTEQSIGLYDKAEALALKANDSSSYALARSYKSGAYAVKGNYAIASKLLLETSDYFQKARDTFNLLFVRNELATLYTKIGFDDEAKKERDEIIAIAKHQRNFNSLVPNLYNASLEASFKGNQAARIVYLKEAYGYVTDPDYSLSLEPVITYALLGAYAVTDSLSKAKVFYDKVQKDFAPLSPIPYESLYRTALADYYIATKAYNKALKEGEWVIDKHKQTKNFWGKFKMDERLSNIYKALGNIEKSHEHYVDFVTLRDSINSVKKVNGLSYYQTLYETEKRDFTITAQNSEIALLDKQNKIKQQWMLFGGLGLVLLFTIIYLLRSRNFSRKEKINQELFSQELIKTQEDQRTQVARDLHDSVGQKLMLLTKKVKSFENNDIDNLAKTTLSELRGISRGLYPATFEKIGVTASIESMINEVDANTDLFFTIDIANIDDVLSQKDALHLYRIIQEVLNNTVKHAKAKSVSVLISKTEDVIETTIKDNGIGFEFNEKRHATSSLGMKTLIERAKIIKSKLSFDSAKNKGTTMQLITPV